MQLRIFSQTGEQALSGSNPILQIENQNSNKIIKCNLEFFYKLENSKPWSSPKGQFFS
jgi:hypothetical protein